MNVGKGFTIEDVKMSVVIVGFATGAVSATGAAHGLMSFGNEVLTVDAALPAADGKTYVVTGEMNQASTMTVADATQAASGSTTLVGSSTSGGSLVGVVDAAVLRHLMVQFKLYPGHSTEVAVNADVDLFGGTDLEAVLSVNETSGSNSSSKEWGVAFGVSMER